MSAALRQRAEVLARRIDAMSLRERVMLFLSLAVVAVALADTLAISPLLARQQALATALRLQDTQLATLRAQLAAGDDPAAADTPAARLQAALQAAQAEQRALEGALAALDAPAAAGSAAPRLDELLARLLQRHERLTLLQLVVAAPTPAGGTPDTAAPTLQAVDLGLAGSYLDLAAYLAAIERALPGLRWGPLRLVPQGGATAPSPSGTAGGAAAPAPGTPSGGATVSQGPPPPQAQLQVRLMLPMVSP